ncbi:hypothetical protein BDY19DRAFT_1060995 [Irpex rosettiformis]|uniref:Uncharacterized protein n=1 Tax=Irpex rosettiformis TaxID=378272 RepID=A0ACB8TMZ6_9APHY|nr:hypothetical protein BDY19DRAFT_1060995 [Irpex rosettiformis]
MAHAPTPYSSLPLCSLVLVPILSSPIPMAHTHVNIPRPVHLAFPVDACLSLLEPPTSDDYHMCTLILFRQQTVTVPSSLSIPTFMYSFEDGYHDSYRRVINEVPEPPVSIA